MKKLVSALTSFRAFVLSALIIVLVGAPVLFANERPWLAGFAAYVGLTMLFLAWNHAVHSLNRNAEERETVRVRRAA